MQRHRNEPRMLLGCRMLRPLHWAAGNGQHHATWMYVQMFFLVEFGAQTDISCFFFFFDVLELRWFKSFERAPHENSASERLTPRRGTWAKHHPKENVMKKLPSPWGFLSWTSLDDQGWDWGTHHGSPPWPLIVESTNEMQRHCHWVSTYSEIGGGSAFAGSHAHAPPLFAADPYEVHMRISILTNCKVIVLRWKNILMRTTAYWESVVRTTKVAGLLTTALGFVIKSFEFQSSDDSGRQVVYTRGERNWREVDKLVCLWSRTTALKSGWKAFRT